MRGAGAPRISALMKILIATYEYLPFRGGIGTYCHEMALAASRQGYDVTVLAPSYGQDNEKFDRSVPFKIARFAGARWSSMRFPGLMRALWQVGVSQFDIVHAADFPMIVALAYLNKWTRLPFLATVHGTEIFAFKQSRLTRLLGVTSPLRDAWRVTANSHYTAGLAIADDPQLTDADVTTTHLGVGEQWFEPAASAEGLLERLGVANGKRIVLTVARLVERKGHRLLLEGLARLEARHKEEIAYLIVGRADNQTFTDELRKLAEGSGVTVIFAEGLSNEDVHALYARSWLFALLAEPDPKRVEGFGLVYLEAAAQGLPSLAAAVGGVPEVVVNGETGCVLSELTPDAVARQLEIWLRDPLVLANMAVKARARAGEFTWDRCARQTYHVEL